MKYRAECPRFFCLHFFSKTWCPYSAIFYIYFDDFEVTFRWFSTFVGDIWELREWLLATRCSNGAPRGPQSKKDQKTDTHFSWGRDPRRGTFGSIEAPNFRKGPFLSDFWWLFSGSKKAVKMELPKGGRMCNPTMPVHVSSGSAVVALAPFWAPFWSNFGGRVRYYTPFWSPGCPKQAHKREANI